VKGRPVLSVALCTYNGAKFLGEQLDSIAAQSLPPAEMVVCDDGSSDGTLGMIERFASQASFPVRIHANPVNLGSTENFSQAIEACRGEVIVLADQDDVWLPAKLERIARAFETHPRAGVAFSDATVVDGDLRPLGRLWDEVGFTRSQRRRIGRGMAANVLVKHNVVTGATMAFRSSYRDRVLPIPAVWVHDAWISLLVACLGNVTTVPEPLVLYRQHDANQIGVGENKKKRKRSGPAPFRARCAKRMLKFQAARDRVADAADAGVARDRMLELLEGKIAHVQARHEASLGGWQRIRITVRELVTLRYHRFSRRDRAFFSDLFRRA